MSDGPDNHKVRNYLMCGEAFPSGGPGERVCRVCKRGAVWTSGNNGDYSVATDVPEDAA